MSSSVAMEKYAGKVADYRASEGPDWQSISAFIDSAFATIISIYLPLNFLQANYENSNKLDVFLKPSFLFREACIGSLSRSCNQYT